jgi:hypothetical protein
MLLLQSSTEVVWPDITLLEEKKKETQIIEPNECIFPPLITINRYFTSPMHAS